jgi:hypothetical protein
MQGAWSTTGYMRGVCTGGGIISVPVIQVGPLGYFVNISITTPIVSALKNYIEVSRNPNGYSKQLLDPGGGFTSETAKRRFQK